MNYVSTLIEETNNLVKLRHSQEILDYEVASIVFDISALITSKGENIKALNSELEFSKNDEERELIQNVVEKQSKEKKQLESFVFSLSEKLKTKKDNVIPFRKN